MILGHYNLSEQPFGVTPDPRFLYLSATHREAMASVLYGVKVNRGFSTLVARPGMGKTTILFDLLQKLRSTERTVFLFQSQCGPRGFLRALLADLGIEDDGKDFLQMNSKLNEFLLRENTNGRRLVVVVDEAQNLSEPVLEVVRMLSNFETSREKLMHVILSGQPQLAEKLSSPNLVQLRQRISIVARLQPFDLDETRNYIKHRLTTAGYDPEGMLFTEKAITLIARHSAGVPRTINNLCFNAMSLGFAMKRRKIDEAIILEVLNDLDLQQLIEQPKKEMVSAPSSEPVRLIPPPVPVPIETAPIVETAQTRRSGWWRRAAIVAGATGLLILPAMYAGVHMKKTLGPANPIKAAETTPLVATPSAEPDAVVIGKNATETGLHVDGGIAAPAAAELPEKAAAGEVIEEHPKTNLKAEETVPEPVAFEEVRVGPNQTLFSITKRHYGKYDVDLLHEIVAMNPEVNNPNRIRAGQILRLPEIPKNSEHSVSVSPRISNSAANEVNKK